MDRKLLRRLTVADTAVIIGPSDAMDVIASRIDTSSETFRRNRQDMLALLAEVEAQLAVAAPAAASGASLAIESAASS